MLEELERVELVLNDIVNLSNGAAEQAIENRHLAPWLRAYGSQQFFFYHLFTCNTTVQYLHYLITGIPQYLQYYSTCFTK